jgi:hypothetical protein
MRIKCLAMMAITLAMTGLFGCGAGGTSATSEPLAIKGSWLFLGPSSGEHNLTISNDSMKYKAISEDWESSWSIKKSDNELHHFQMAFESGHGSYYPEGQSFSGTFDLNGTILSVQLAKGLDSYPELRNAGSCTDNSDPIPDCKLYMKQ